MASTSATPSPAQLPPHVHPLQDGDPGRIGDYTLIGRLGSGGMGTVYAGVSAEQGRVAVKVAHPAPGEQSRDGGSGGSESRANTRFKREIELMRRVQGVCAVTVHDSGEHEGRPWAAIEYVPGLDLHRYVREHGPLTGDPLLLLAAGCAEALAAIHTARVAHGDIKPGNVLMAPGGPKIVDYGIARLLEDHPTGTVSGSLGWMAPERYRGAEPEPESDMFAWGCLVVFAATGESPFGRVPTGGSRREAVTEMARRSELGLEGVAADLSAIPEEIRDLVRRSLATRAADRPEADGAYKDCVRALGEEPGESREPGERRRLRELLGERWPSIDIGWDRPSRWLGAAAAVAASGSAPVHDSGGSGADLGGTEAARVAEGLAGSGAGGSGTGAVAGSGAGTGGTGGVSAATGGTGAVGAAGAGAKMTSMIVGGCLGVAVVAGGGYLALDRLGGDEEEVQVAAEPEEEESEEPEPLTGPELVEAAQESVMEADDYELLVYSFGTENPEPRQEAPADPDAPYTFDYAHVLAGPGEPAYRASHMNWWGGSTVTMSVDGELVYETSDGGWVEADPFDRTNPDAHATEHILGAFFGMLDAGQNTDEDESDFVPIPAPEAEFAYPEADPVDTAVRIDGEITHEGLEGEVTTAYALVTTPEGVPLSFSLAQTYYNEWQRPWPMGNPTGPTWEEFSRDQPYMYTEYTFVSVDEGVELEAPAPDEIAAWDE